MWLLECNVTELVFKYQPGFIYCTSAILFFAASNSKMDGGAETSGGIRTDPSYLCSPRGSGFCFELFEGYFSIKLI